jgi:hypothetical protein
MGGISLMLIQEILNGDFDDSLQVIGEAIKERRAIKARMKFFELQIGDRVMLADSVRPKYLVGAPATVSRKKQKRIEITIDREWIDHHPEARRFAGFIGCTPNMVEII